MDNLKLKNKNETGAHKKPDGVLGKPDTSKQQRSAKPQPSTSKTGGALDKPGTSHQQRSAKPQPSTSKNIGDKNIRPSMQAYRLKRSARRVLDKLSQIPAGKQTEEQKASLIWASGVIGGKPVTTTSNATKRQRSIESPQEGNSKKPRSKGPPQCELNKPQKAFSEVLRDQLTVAVIDRSDEDGKISFDNWKKVETQLASKFLQMMKDNQVPAATRIVDKGWHRNAVKIVACADEKSLEVYKLVISSLGEIWPGAQLDVVPRDQIPSRPRARVWLPVAPSAPGDILSIMRFSNPELPTGNWKVAKLEEAKGDSRQAILVLNQESLPSLVRTKGVIGYGFSSITLKIYKKDEEQGLSTLNPAEPVAGPASEKPSEPNSSSELETPHAPESNSEDESLLLGSESSPRVGDLFKRDGSSIDSDELRLSESMENLNDITVVEMSVLSAAEHAEDITDKSPPL